MHQCQYPVLYINFEDVKASTFWDARVEFSTALSRMTTAQYPFLLDSPKLLDIDKEQCRTYLRGKGERDQFGNLIPPLTMEDLSSGLTMLSEYLKKHYEKKVVILIDDYDVPLHSAWVNREKDEGYYDNMAGLIQNMFSSLLKDNNSMAFAVLTGCLPIPRGDIFSGLNNLTTVIQVFTHMRSLECLLEELLARSDGI